MPLSLAEQLAAQQRKRIVIEGDGNCLFRALASTIYKTQDMHTKMRAMLVDFVANNKTQFQPFLTTPLEDHIRHMRYERIWGTAIELMAAASLMLHHLCVYRWVRYNPLKESALVFPEEPYPTQANDLNHIELLHTSGCHYDCIGTTDEGLPSLIEPHIATTVDYVDCT